VTVPARLAAFAAVLGLAGAGAALAGAAIDPTKPEATVAEPGHGGAATHADRGHPTAGAAPAGGLAVSQDGLGLDVRRRSFGAGERAVLRFRITDARGRAVRDGFQVEHARELHLIVVRRDTAGFQHLHPRRAQDGTWSVELVLPEAGVYRAYADFKVDGRKRTLATDLFVAGDFRPERLPAPAPVDRTGDLAVALAAPGLRAGRETELRFAVSRGGVPFEHLEPYLGARGHLVALREGDLAYLHVHPVDGGAAPPAHADGSTGTEAHENELRFATTFPTPGRYRLFLQVKVGGAVRTVAHTVRVRR
jgi:hypothetical protein